jgi:hypothetical protein
MQQHNFQSCHLSSSTPRLAHGVPIQAPPGTLFALGDSDGYAMAPRRFTLFFGRDQSEVHIPVGVGNQHVSRQQGRLVCDGRDWRIQNTGKLPLHSPGRPLLLRGHDLLLHSGYTPLVISTSPTRAHLLEVLIIGAGSGEQCAPTSTTITSSVYDLDETDLLVLVALAQRYLLQEHYAQPVTWKQAADTLSQVRGQREWNARRAEHHVASIRHRLATGPKAIPGILRRDDDVAEPVGNTLSHNLIQALLASGTLVPAQLALIEEG